MLKWEQLFVAYSDCGQYKVEVDRCGCEGMPHWDWSTHARCGEKWDFVDEGLCFPCATSAKGEGNAAFERILSDSLPDSGEFFDGLKHIAEHAQAWKPCSCYIGLSHDQPDCYRQHLQLGVSGLNSVARGSTPPKGKCLFCGGTGVHQCPGGTTLLEGFLGGPQRVEVFPGLVDANAYPADRNPSFKVEAVNEEHEEQAKTATKVLNHLIGGQFEICKKHKLYASAPSGIICAMCKPQAGSGSVAVDNAKPSIAGRLALFEALTEACGEQIKCTPEQAKLLGFPEEEFSLPYCDTCGEEGKPVTEHPMPGYDPVCAPCLEKFYEEVAVDYGMIERPEQLSPELERAIDHLSSIKPKTESGYDQILSLIKREAKEIEL